MRSYGSASRLLPSALLSLVVHVAVLGSLFWTVSHHRDAPRPHSMPAMLTVEVASLKPAISKAIGEGRLETPRTVKPKPAQAENTSDVPTATLRNRSLVQNRSREDTVVTPVPSKSRGTVNSRHAALPETTRDTSASRRVASTSRLTPNKKEHENKYLADLHAAIAGNRFYPERARRDGREGRVVIGVTIRRDGEITNIAVVEPSGSRLLDSAASKAVRSLGRFRPFSSRIADSTLTTQVAFTYRLEN